MASRNQWQAFFDVHAPHYMENVFTRNTQAEVDFVLEELGLAPGAWILDMGCGTGRHAVELARRGYHVTGVDISSGMLAEAQKAADAAGVTVEWIQSDAVYFQATRLYDGAICLCEGAFGLIGLDDDPIEHSVTILLNISNALKPGAGFILTALNAFAAIRQLKQEDIDTGHFDPGTMTSNNTDEWDLPGGKQTVQVRERSVVPSEIVLMCRLVGMDVLHIWGGTAGNWDRYPLDLNEIEVMAVAKKLPNPPQ